jgi:hypothetical protein
MAGLSFFDGEISWGYGDYVVPSGVFNVAGLPSGSHTLTIGATDEDGLDPTPHQLGFVLDRTKPTMKFLRRTGKAGQPPRRTRKRRLSFRVRLVDDEGFQTYVRVPPTPNQDFVPPPSEALTLLSKPELENVGVAASMDGFSSFSPPLTVSQVNFIEGSHDRPEFGSYWTRSYELVLRTPPLDKGQHVFRLKATDAAGNRAKLLKWSFKVN